MSAVPEANLIILETACRSLQLSLKALDALGLSLSAAHVDTALNSIRAELSCDSVRARLTQSPLIDNSELDVKIDSLFEIYKD
jgi:hypothetical protein